MYKLRPMAEPMILTLARIRGVYAVKNGSCNIWTTRTAHLIVVFAVLLVFFANA
jgi:hypothetical protein